MNRALIGIVQDVVLHGPQRAEDVAAAIGKPYSTLMRELNPFDSGAKLGAETLLAIVRVTGNTAPLEFLAREAGCLLLPGAVESAPQMHQAGHTSRMSC